MSSGVFPSSGDSATVFEPKPQYKKYTKKQFASKKQQHIDSQWLCRGPLGELPTREGCPSECSSRSSAYKSGKKNEQAIIENYHVDVRSSTPNYKFINDLFVFHVCCITYVISLCVRRTPQTRFRSNESSRCNQTAASSGPPFCAP